MAGYSSKAEVNGYNAGIYGTWFANDADKSGLYVDSWAQYSWFKNLVNGEKQAQEKYNFHGVSAAVETCYTPKISDLSDNKQGINSVYIQTQAQITWMEVNAHDHTEVNGTHENGEGNGNIQTRLGSRVFLKGLSQIDDGKDREFEPFVEAYWLHNTYSYSTRMNSERVSHDDAQNIGELRTGFEGQLSRNFITWINIGQQLGGKG